MTMQQSQWAGVFPAITTPFRDDQSVDHDALAAHVRWLADAGCAGIVTGGSLGEAATLTFDEKVRVNEICVRAIDGRIPVVAGIAGLATAECVALARAAERAGCDGIMALPAYVYYSDWREAREHYGAIIGATRLSCMLYNNPIAYRTDVLPEQLAELAERHAFRRRETGDAGDDGNAPVDRADARLVDAHLLVVRERRGLAERSARHDAGAPRVGQPANVLGQRIVVDRQVVAEGSGDGREDAGPL